MTSDDATTLSGAPIASDEHSLTTGPDGITALHDRYTVEKLAHFARERIPERVVHAKGGGAFGDFVVTHDVSRYTRAAVFQPRESTRVLARFSTVAGEQGSPDTWRDVRGFSVKFYSREGNYDIVGNNTPTFFIRDGIKFPDFIHSQKRLPGSGLRDADMQWDFFTLSPESAHQVTYLMGDRGNPLSWRTMPGYGSHTYQWINAVGDRFWVKYHWAPAAGRHEITQDTADALAGVDPDHYRRDLHEAIERGDHPSWELSVQIMPYDDAVSYRFNPFDVTKIWPHADYPLVPVGRMTLSENPENFFAQIEQAAFSPANTVPGTDLSPDKMLMARVFSYPDAQRYRLGVNYHDLPSNRPIAPVRTYMQDGAGTQHYRSAASPNYAPNSSGGPVANPDAAGAGSWETDGTMIRAAQTLHAEDDDFGQAGSLYRDVFSSAAKARFLDVLAGSVSAVRDESIRARAIEYWRRVDAALGAALDDRVDERLAGGRVVPAPIEAIARDEASSGVPVVSRGVTS